MTAIISAVTVPIIPTSGVSISKTGPNSVGRTSVVVVESKIVEMSWRNAEHLGVLPSRHGSLIGASFSDHGRERRD